MTAAAHVIKMFDDITWQSVLNADEHFNHLVEVVTADLKHFNDPRKYSASNPTNLHF